MILYNNSVEQIESPRKILNLKEKEQEVMKKEKRKNRRMERLGDRRERWVNVEKQQQANITHKYLKKLNNVKSQNKPISIDISIN